MLNWRKAWLKSDQVRFSLKDFYNWLVALIVESCLFFLEQAGDSTFVIHGHGTSSKKMKDTSKYILKKLFKII